jgi:hypothetical protein
MRAMRWMWGNQRGLERRGNRRVIYDAPHMKPPRSRREQNGKMRTRSGSIPNQAEGAAWN